MMRLRQIALVARDLDTAVADLRLALDLGEPFHDPGVEVFGLCNAVFPIGETFLEVVSPIRADCSGARYLERRGGDGGYMVIAQTDDLAAARRRIEMTGTRIVFEFALDEIATLHLHPRDTGGTLLSIDAATEPAEWRWAGPGWRERSRTARCTGVVGAEIQCETPAEVAARWSRLLARPSVVSSDGGCEIALDGSVLRFVPLRDDRGEGLHTVVLRRAGGTAPGDIPLCGTRFHLV